VKARKGRRSSASSRCSFSDAFATGCVRNVCVCVCVCVRACLCVCACVYVCKAYVCVRARSTSACVMRACHRTLSLATLKYANPNRPLFAMSAGLF
jgi:hypothetical protein